MTVSLVESWKRRVTVRETPEKPLVASVSDTESRPDGDFVDRVVLALLPRECKNSGGKF